MKKRSLLVLTVVCISALIAFGQSNRKKAAPGRRPSRRGTQCLRKSNGSRTFLGELGTTAQVQVPAGYLFAGADDTRTIMVANQNPTTGRELGFVAPAGENGSPCLNSTLWVTSKTRIKTASMRMRCSNRSKPALKRGTRRAKRGWPAMTIIGWETPPRYDEITHNLEWA